MEHIIKIPTKITQIVNEKKLKPNERLIYRFIIETCQNSGRTPQQISYTKLMNIFKLSRQQIYNIVRKLTEYGLIEKWTTFYYNKKGQLVKAVYIRLKIIYLNN